MAASGNAGRPLETLIASNRGQARPVNNRGIDSRADGSTSFERRVWYGSSAAGGWTSGFHFSGFFGESVDGRATPDSQPVPDRP
jgi:hypothetical protein